MGKYVLAWIPMVFIAIANGAIREGWYGKHLRELQAHQISTISGVLLFGVYIWLLIRLWRPASAGQAITIGLVWLGMTVAFEFLFGHYVARRLWRDLLLTAGRRTEADAIEETEHGYDSKNYGDNEEYRCYLYTKNAHP